jgi:hypothetical protein
MKRLLICLVALIAVFAFVMPASAAEMKVSGIWNAKGYAINNYDGTDDEDDSWQYVTQRFRSYWNFIASENLKLVYKNEIDIEWGDNDQVVTTNNGDDSVSLAANRNSGGGLGGDRVNMETKNIYLEFMVPDTPVKATLGLQGITLHKGWFVSDDFSAAKFDMNFDPVSITAYWAGLSGLEAQDADASNDNWQIVASGAYKAENLDARLTFGYERKPNERPDPEDPTGAGVLAAGTSDNDLFLVMGEFNMSFDMFSFFVIAGTNFGEADGTGAASANNRDYSGYMFNVGGDVALDMATLKAGFIFTSGDDEGDFDDDFQVMSGATYSWAEIISDGYTYDRSASLSQIGAANKPSNMWAVHLGADFKPTDTTSIMLDAYYIGMVEDRTVGGSEEDEIGIEIDARLTQKIYDNLSLTVIGAYMLAEDGYGTDRANSEGDDAYQVGVGMDFKF